MPSRRGFHALLASQFCGAVNDNILKQVLVFMVIAGGLWDQDLGPGGQGIVLACFTLPFIVLSGVAGQMADRWCKRRVTIVVRATEIPIAAVAAAGFVTGNLWLTLGSLVLLSVQSAFFGPAKYGMIPELVPPQSLSRANGSINMLTNVATIVGTVLAGRIADGYHPKPPGPAPGFSIPVPWGPPASVMWDASGDWLGWIQLPPVGIGLAGAVGPGRVAWTDPLAVPAGDVWAPGIALLVVAVLGLLAAIPIPPLGARRPGLSLRFNPIGAYASSVRRMAGGPLLGVVLTWGFFYLLAGIALLILPEYHLVLGVDRFTASVLLGVLGIAIGFGSLVAGIVSGRHVELRLVPIGAAILAVSFLMLGLDSSRFSRVVIWLSLAGIGAGLYLVPLQATIQRLAPAGDRGRFIGTANAISFVFLFAGSLLYSVLRPFFGFDQAQRMFLVSAGILAVGGVGIVTLGRGFALAAIRDVRAASRVDALPVGSPRPEGPDGPVPPTAPAAPAAPAEAGSRGLPATSDDPASDRPADDATPSTAPDAPTDV